VYVVRRADRRVQVARDAALQRVTIVQSDQASQQLIDDRGDGSTDTAAAALFGAFEGELIQHSDHALQLVTAALLVRRHG
jgi:predicted RNA-binding protein with PIN domain